MITQEQTLREAERLLSVFSQSGAERVDPMLLQASDTLLDLYGEAIRARAYVTHDPSQGEVFLRPDFTVPIAQMHLARRDTPAGCYCYSGPVFRKQEFDPKRAREFHQVGVEIFDDTPAVEADAALFTLIKTSLGDAPLRAAIGDIAILSAAIEGLETSELRISALKRHLWRPNRFRMLLDRFAGKTPQPAARVSLLAATDPLDSSLPFIGLRSSEEIQHRIENLRRDAAEPPIPSQSCDLIEALLSIRASAPQAVEHLRDLAVDLPAISEPLDELEARLDALQRRGIDLETLDFEASYGRTSMEYYDGFVFGFFAENRIDLPPIASGGRYDAMTAVLTHGSATPAIGGVIRPDLLVMVKEATQ